MCRDHRNHLKRYQSETTVPVHPLGPAEKKSRRSMMPAVYPGRGALPLFTRASVTGRIYGETANSVTRSSLMGSLRWPNVTCLGSQLLTPPYQWLLGLHVDQWPSRLSLFPFPALGALVPAAVSALDYDALHNLHLQLQDTVSCHISRHPCVGYESVASPRGLFTEPHWPCWAGYLS